MGTRDLTKQEFPMIPLDTPDSLHIGEPSAQDSTDGEFLISWKRTQTQNPQSQPSCYSPSNGIFPVAISQRTIPKLKENQETENHITISFLPYSSSHFQKTQ
jgi:hypothetical protein